MFFLGFLFFLHSFEKIIAAFCILLSTDVGSREREDAKRVGAPQKVAGLSRAGIQGTQARESKQKEYIDSPTVL